MKTQSKQGWINPLRILDILNSEEKSAENITKYRRKLAMKIKSVVEAKLQIDYKENTMNEFNSQSEMNKILEFLPKLQKVNEKEIDFWKEMQDTDITKTILGVVPEFSYLTELVNLGHLRSLKVTNSCTSGTRCVSGRSTCLGASIHGAVSRHRPDPDP